LQVAEACQLGTAHPPGYPLFTMLLHVVTMWLPKSFGATPAARANLFCAACGAAAAGLLAASVVICVRSLGFCWGGGAPSRSRTTASASAYNNNNNNNNSGRGGSSSGGGEAPRRFSAWACGAGAAGLWAFSPLVWQYAVTAEVFALNNLLCALVVYSCLSFAVSKRFKDACAGAFFVGLSLANQHTAVLFCAPIAAWVVLVALAPLLLSSDREVGIGGGIAKNCVSRLVALGLSGLLGLSPYMYLPLSAWLNPKPGAWGHVRSFGGLLHHLRRGDYGSFQLYSGGSGSESPWERVGRWLDDLVMRQSPDVMSMYHQSQGTLSPPPPPPLPWLRWIPLAALGGLGACCLVVVPLVKMMRANTTLAGDVGGSKKKKEKATAACVTNNDDEDEGSEGSSKKKKKKGSTDKLKKTRERMHKYHRRQH